MTLCCLLFSRVKPRVGLAGPLPVYLCHGRFRVAESDYNAHTSEDISLVGASVSFNGRHPVDWLYAPNHCGLWDVSGFFRNPTIIL